MSNKTLEQKIAVMRHYANGGKIMINGELWFEGITPRFNWERNEYSIYEEPKTTPSINWDHVSPEYKWMATDESGDTYLYRNKPSQDSFTWDDYDPFAAAESFSSFTPGTCDWKDSLVQRPE